MDKADSGNFTAEEILDPRGWVLMAFVMTGGHSIISRTPEVDVGSLMLKYGAGAV